MINPILLCEVARLHQRDLEKEVASRIHQSGRISQIYQTRKDETLHYDELHLIAKWSNRKSRRSPLRVK